MTTRTIKICNYIIGFLIALNVIIFFVLFSNTIGDLIYSHYGFIAGFKYDVFLINYGTAIFNCTLGTLLIVTGICLRISCKPKDVENESWKFVLSYMLICSTLASISSSLLEYIGIINGTYIAS